MADRFDDWSVTAGSNTTVNSISIAEGMAPANVNDAVRAVMAAAALSFGGFPQASSRPSIVAAGSFWLDTTTATAPIIKLYDGSDDITVMTFNYTANSVSLAGSELVNDTSPQLGGNLDLNSNVITGLEIGTDVQAFDATLTSLAAVSGVAGDVLYASGTDAWARLAKGANGKVLGLLSGVPAWVAAGGQLLHIQDQKTSGSDGGTFTSGSWQKRTCDDVQTNEISGASESSSVITLPAGTYWIEASAPAKRTNNNKIRFRNTSDSSDAVIGQNTNANTDDTSSGHSFAQLKGRFTIASAKNFELQHRAQTTRSTDGFGAAATFSVVEVYADVSIWKVG